MSDEPDLKKTRRKKLSAEPLRTDRLPPHCIATEQGLLGAIMLSPRDNMSEVNEKFKAGADVFYDLRHQEIFSVLLEMDDNNEEIDLITVQAKLKNRNQLEAIGGFAYLASMPDKAGTAGHVGSYAQIMWEKYILRKVIQTCSDVIGRCYEHEGEIERLVDELEADILQIGDERVNDDVKPMKEIVATAIDRIESYSKNEGKAWGLTTGFDDIDALTGGLHNGEVTIIGARPSMGKTSLLMNIVENVALIQGFPVGVFSLEMDSDVLVERILFSHSRINARRVRAGHIQEGDFPKFGLTAAKLVKSKLRIEDKSGIDILTLKAKARRMKHSEGIRLLAVDYLQLVTSKSKRAQANRQQEISDISNAIKCLARELKIPVLVACQLNRELDKEKNRKPRLADLRESGSIEQDADNVWLLFKPPSENGEPEDEIKNSENADPYPVGIVVPKQRNNPQGEVYLNFVPQETRFETRKREAPVMTQEDMDKADEWARSQQ